MVLTMQGMLSSETRKADEAKQAHRSALVQNEELSKRLDEAGRKINQLQDSVQRFVFMNKFEICHVVAPPCETSLYSLYKYSPLYCFLDDNFIICTKSKVNKLLFSQLMHLEI